MAQWVPPMVRLNNCKFSRVQLVLHHKWGVNLATLCYPECGSKVWEKSADIDNIPMSVKMEIHADNLHNEGSLITRRASITSIVNTLKQLSYQDMFMKHMYLTFIMTVVLNYLTCSFFLSNIILMNWNILFSSLSGQVIWRNLIIRNSQKKRHK